MNMAHEQCQRTIAQTVHNTVHCATGQLYRDRRTLPCAQGHPITRTGPPIVRALSPRASAIHCRDIGNPMFRDSLLRQLKCNLDGAIFEDSCQMGVGGVIQDEVGAIVHAFSQVFTRCVTPAEVEALAVCEALHQILQLQSSNTMLEMDCKEVSLHVPLVRQMSLNLGV